MNKGFYVYNNIKKALWIVSTGISYILGFIIVAIPISFALFMETDNELQKLISHQESKLYKYLYI